MTRVELMKLLENNMWEMEDLGTDLYSLMDKDIRSLEAEILKLATRADNVFGVLTQVLETLEDWDFAVSKKQLRGRKNKSKSNRSNKSKCSNKNNRSNKSKCKGKCNNKKKEALLSLYTF